jgi:hypothetical protein
MNEVIPLSEQIKALHPDTGKPIVIVGIDVSSVFGPKLVVIERGPNGIWAKTIEYADELPQ